MWMLVMFDLPVIEPKERKAATTFRNFLLDEGFEMAQFSVYVRFCSGKEQAAAILRRLKVALPTGGKIDVLFFTDKQYENIVSFHNSQRQSKRKNPDQYCLF